MYQIRIKLTRALDAAMAGSMFWLTALIAVLCFMALSGCGGGGDGTPAGKPQGTPSSAVIGASGGQLSTPDGRLTVDVPAGAFTKDETVSIQAISNEAHGGLGIAYRITPEGLHTSVPMTLRFHFDDAEIASTSTRYLSVAYQDASGVWHAYRSPALNAADKTLSVQTTHFSDWSMFAGVQLRPPKATVHVGQTVQLQLMSCEQVQEDVLTSILHKCQDFDPADRTVFWSVNGVLGGGGQIGTVKGLDSTNLTNDAVYTAPAHVPNGESMVVAVSAELFDPQHPSDYQIIMVSNVTVEDELARSCEWLRTVDELDFDIAFDPVNYTSTDGYASHLGKHGGRVTGRLKKQSQVEQLAWWTAELETVQGSVSIDDVFQNHLIKETTQGSGQAYSSAVTGGPNPDGVNSAAMLYVDYTNCTYILNSAYGVMATVTDYDLTGDHPPEAVTKPVRVGGLGFESLPLYSTYSVLRSIHVERTAAVVQTLEPGSSGYAPEHYSGTIQPGGEVSVRWTIKPSQ